MNEVLKIVVISSALVTAICGLIVFLIRAVVKVLIERDVEKFKAQLQLSVKEREIQFSTLHIKRAKIITQLYSKLVDVHTAMEAFIKDHSGDLNSPKRQEALSKLGELKDFTSKNRIYFDDQICELLDDIITKLGHIDMDKFLANDFKNVANFTGNIEDAKESEKLKKEIWDTVHNTVPVLQEQLRKKFQKLLGVKNTD